MDKSAFFLPQSKYLKDTNPYYSYNQKSYAGGFRNDCSGFRRLTLQVGTTVSGVRTTD